MDRIIVYPAQIPLETHLLNMAKNVMIAMAKMSAAVLGTSTSVNGLTASPTAPASLVVSVAPGEIYSLTDIDDTAYSSLAADTAHQILKQGISLDKIQLNCAAPATAGQSINYLVQAAFSEVDGTAVVLPYYNSANPATAFSGPNNSGAAQATLRQGKVSIVAKAGAAAATGSQVTPAPDSGYVPLYVVTVANGQTAINAGDIALSPTAPVINSSLLGQSPAFTVPPTVPAATLPGHALSLGQATGRLMRTTIYMLIAGTLKVSVDGAAFTTAATTFTKHPLSAVAEIRLIGGGGAGGGTTSGPNGYTAAAAGGAEGGGCWTILNASAINGVAVTIGAGGIASSGANGGNGGTTSLGSILSATGGAGANVQPAVPGSTNTFSGLSLGGQGVGGVINYMGAMGKSAFLSQSGSVSGEGGGSQLGAGGALVSGTAGGTAATNPGAGGSGGCVSDAGINSSGGNGASGIIIIIERTA